MGTQQIVIREEQGKQMARRGEGFRTASWLPDLRNLIRRVRVRIHALRYRELAPREIFERIYASKVWGEKHGSEFDSGSGSDDLLALAYVNVISAYIREQGITSVVDLGCGDFRIGRHLANRANVLYTGIDVVRPLIEHHNRMYADHRTRFVCGDIISGALPSGELYLIRQVLQHLSNAQIAGILKKLDGQRVVVTEHVPAGKPKHPNRDKAAGPDIRLYFGSGVYLEYPPFNQALETLLEVPAPFNGRQAVLRTSLLIAHAK